MNLVYVKVLTGFVAYVIIAGVSSLIVWLILGRKCSLENESTRQRIYESHNRICLFIAGILIAMTFFNLIPDVKHDMLKVITKNDPLAIYVSQLGIIGSFLAIWLFGIFTEFIIVSVHRRALADESRKILDLTTPLEAHYDVVDHSNGTATAIVLSFALSVHSFLEGLTVGIQETGAMVTLMGSVLALHECMLVVAITLKVKDAGVLKYGTLVFIGLAFSTVTPVGILVGTAIKEPNISISCLIAFRCLATGGILYVVFLEMIPHCVFAANHARWINAVLITAGIAVSAVVAFIQVYEHKHTIRPSNMSKTTPIDHV